GQPPNTQPQRYVAREVPPRFRSQQDHKVLLKRGQPPLSCMLLGGGAPSLSPGDAPNATTIAASPTAAAADAPAASSPSSTSITAAASIPPPSSSSSSSNYANSMWRASSGSLAPSQGWEKVIVDESNMEEWPSIGMGVGGDGGGGASSGAPPPSETHSGSHPNTGSAWAPHHQHHQKPKPPHLSAFSGSQDAGAGAAVSGEVSADWKVAAGGGGGSSSISSANFHPNANPSAWPALVQQEAGAEGAGGGGGISPSPTSASPSPSSLNPSLHSSAVNSATHHYHHQPPPHSQHNPQLQPIPGRDRHRGDWPPTGQQEQGPKLPGPPGEGPDCGGGGGGGGGGGMVAETSHSLSGSSANSSSSTSSSSSWRAASSHSKPGSARTDPWEGRGGGGDAGGGGGDISLSWGNQGSSQEGRPGEGLGGRVWGSGSGGNCKAPGVSQGAWGGGAGAAGEEGSLGEWGNSSEGAGASPAPTPPLTRAWDNQKAREEWGTGRNEGGGRGGGAGGGGGGRGGGGGNNHNQTAPSSSTSNPHHHHRPPPQLNTPEVALQHLLSRADLDPRVLSNSGWGQTQIRQNVAWDVEGAVPPPPGSSHNHPHLHPQTQGQGWGGEGQDWRERGRGGGGGGAGGGGSGGGGAGGAGGGGGGGWGDFGQQGTGGGGVGGWGSSQEEKGIGGGGGAGGWNEGGWSQRVNSGSGSGGGNEWGGEREPKPGPGGGGWGEGKGGAGGDAGWGSWDEGGARRGWGGGGGGGGGATGDKQHPGWSKQPNQIPNSQQSLKMPGGNSQQQQQPPPPMESSASQGSWGRTGGPSSSSSSSSSSLQSQSHTSGWTSGPIPQVGELAGLEPSGWEEPSPQSISRKMEIDDGTSAWGDPNCYSQRAVNLWDKNGGGGGIWGSSAPSGPAVDNGTAAWGKPTEAPTGWGDPEDTGKAVPGWGNPSPNPLKSGSKSMQEGWGEAEASVSASRHSSWEEEEEGGGVWSSTGSQGSSSSYNSSGWGQGPPGKKTGSKGTLKGGGGDSWMAPISRQFSHMGLLGDDPGGRPMDLAPGPPPLDKKLEGEKRGMNLSDFNGEMRKGGRAPFRSPSSKEVGSGEAGPYYDKPGSHSVFGGNSGMAQSRGIHQAGVPPLNPSPGIRAQVPPQFLSPQVQASVLKQMPASSGLGGGVFGVGPQLSPQHLAMLSQLPHIQQQFHLLLLQQQQQQQQQQQLLQNQRKFPQNLRQQPDPQQLARMMSALQQQQQRQQQGGGGSKLSPSHLGGGAPKTHMSEPLPHPGLGGGLADLHPKTQAGGYSGFGSGVSLPGLELGSMVGGPGGGSGGGMKEVGGQSRFRQWTGLMEGLSPATSPPNTGLHKNGPIGAPGKLRGGSPYSHYELEGLGGAPGGGGDSWLPHRPPPNKLPTKTGSSSWPPEFQPGVPWKGIQSADPESDPYMTPGSVLGTPGPPTLTDTEHQLLRDNTGSSPSLNTLLPSPGAWPYSASDSPHSNAHNSGSLKYSEYKPSWPPDPIGHNKLWKTNRNSSQMPRPPPGLTNQKQPSASPWAGGNPRLARGWGGGGGQDSRYGPGSPWSDGGARGSCWLVLNNLTPQIDGSTLRTICMQHGPLLTFHLSLTQGSALIRYSSRQEAAKAQSALHMCVLGNTTILAEFVSEEEVTRYFAHSQAGGGGGPGSSGGWQSLDGTGSSQDGSSPQGPGLSIFAQWSSNGGGGGGGGVVVGGGGNSGNGDPQRQGLWGGVTPGYPTSLWGAPQLDDRHQVDSPAPLLPGDLLGGGSDSI
ncbi:TNR6B protein, partial [Amia calva]|nr:TNR6B protein [Amia calva]